MFDRRNIRRIYLNITGKAKDFLLSDKSREFFVFLFFFFIAGGFWLLQTLNNDYEAEFSIPVRLRGVPNNTMITSEPVSELHIKVKDKGTVLLNYMLGKSFYPVSLDFSDYKAVDNHVRIYASQFEKKSAESVECFHPLAFYEARYLGIHLCNGNVQIGACQIIGDSGCRPSILFVGYDF